MDDHSMARPLDRALLASLPEPQSVSALPGDDSSRFKLLEAIERFTRESNHIEGIFKTRMAHVDAHIAFLKGPVTIPALVEFVGVMQPDATLRDRASVPGVRVGNHIAPPSGPKIVDNLRRILAMRDPWEQHVAYETLHPFTDGNGRSGRAIWLHRHFHEKLDPWAVERGFLHSWYYHTLASVRLRDSDEHRNGENAQRSSGEAMPARACKASPETSLMEANDEAR